MRIHSVHKLIDQRRRAATKPFNARGAKVERCCYCQVAQDYCICSLQPDINTEVAVLLLMSESEVLKPSNTGRLIADVIKETYTYQWSRTEPDPKLVELVQSSDYFPVVVFPQEYVENADRLIDKLDKPKLGGKKLLLIFIDSNWREARKIFRKSAYLTSLPVVSIKPDLVSQYVMRSSENENHLSTAEVAAVVLNMAKELDAAEVLTAWFALFRESYLLSKTRLRPDLSRPAITDYRKIYARIKETN